MRVLLVKTSSLGDILHTFPGITDATAVHPDIQFDWVVEEGLADIPSWHPNINTIIPVAVRRWRQQKWQPSTWWEAARFIKKLRAKTYDVVLDAQGLLKSALIAKLCHGTIHGLDPQSSRGKFASKLYHHQYPVPWERHAIIRIRQLFANVFGYAVPQTPIHYGVQPPALSPDVLSIISAVKPHKPYIMLLHGTTWENKHWPEEYWCTLAKMITEQQINVVIPWGNDSEKQRAEKIAEQSNAITVLPKLKLSAIATILSGAQAAVAVDTGLGHVAAALSVPTVSLYGPTSPQRTGTLGAHQIHIAASTPCCAPCLQKKCRYPGKTDTHPACFTDITPEYVFRQLQQLLNHHSLKVFL